MKLLCSILLTFLLLTGCRTIIESGKATRTVTTSQYYYTEGSSSEDNEAEIGYEALGDIDASDFIFIKEVITDVVTIVGPVLKGVSPTDLILPSIDVFAGQVAQGRMQISFEPGELSSILYYIGGGVMVIAILIFWLAGWKLGTLTLLVGVSIITAGRLVAEHWMVLGIPFLLLVATGVFILYRFYSSNKEHKVLEDLVRKVPNDELNKVCSDDTKEAVRDKTIISKIRRGL